MKLEDVSESIINLLSTIYGDYFLLTDSSADKASRKVCFRYQNHPVSQRTEIMFSKLF